MKYWELAQALESGKLFGSMKKMKRIHEIIFKTGCFLIIILSLVSVYLNYYDKAPYFQQAILPILYLTSCAFLIAGLRKIKDIMTKMSSEIASEKHFILHIASYSLFLLGQIPNIIMGYILGDGYQSTKSFLAFAIINNFTASCSIFCLLVIFNQICTNSMMPRTITLSSEGQTPTESSFERNE